MDQDQSKAGQELAAEEDRTPEQVRAEIEQTRAELGDTVSALAEKTDVKAQTQHAVNEAKETVAGKISDVKETIVDKQQEFVSAARDATPDSASDAGQRVATAASKNRLPLAALAALLIGFLIGRRAR